MFTQIKEWIYTHLNNMNRSNTIKKFLPLMDHLEVLLNSKTIRNYRYIDLSRLKQARSNSKYIMVTLFENSSLEELKIRLAGDLALLCRDCSIKSSTLFPHKLWIYP